MTGVVWFISITSAAVAIMALFNTVLETDDRKRAVNAGSVAYQTIIAIWGLWLLFAPA